jgi:hypothetical protein
MIGLGCRYFRRWYVRSSASTVQYLTAILQPGHLRRHLRRHLHVQAPTLAPVAILDAAVSTTALVPRPGDLSYRTYATFARLAKASTLLAT